MIFIKFFNFAILVLAAVIQIAKYKYKKLQ